MNDLGEEETRGLESFLDAEMEVEERNEWFVLEWEVLCSIEGGKEREKEECGGHVCVE
jgi:hypothetical protein